MNRPVAIPMSVTPGDDAGLKPGEARCPTAPMIQEIIKTDAIQPPPVLTHENFVYLGDEDIPFERYTSPDFFKRELEKVWLKSWQWACREEHIPEVGDNYVYEVGPYSVIVVRAESGIKAYINSCLHRGTKFRNTQGDGHASQLRCPYHGWTWNLEGELKAVPCAWDFPHVKPDEFKLPEVKVGLWGGFVFINMDEDENAPSLEEFLAPLPEHFATWDMDKRFVELHMAKELPCNWKTAQEAFMEAYHVLETHPQLMTGQGDVQTQYDSYGDHISRFYSPGGTNSAHLENPLTDQELLDVMLVGDRSVLDPDALKLGEGETARIVMARFLRKALGEKYGVDLSRFSDSEMIDTIEYHVFPNMVLFPGLSLPMVYRFRPIGENPDRTLFEILFLRPVPENGPRPSPAECFYVKEEESYTIVPGMDYAMGEVYDQDTNNLRAQQAGFKASRKKKQTLASYQESRIRHFNRTIDKYMAR